jgi:hypothetical protein
MIWLALGASDSATVADEPPLRRDYLHPPCPIKHPFNAFEPIVVSDSDSDSADSGLPAFDSKWLGYDPYSGYLSFDIQDISLQVVPFPLTCIFDVFETKA